MHTYNVSGLQTEYSNSGNLLSSLVTSWQDASWKGKNGKSHCDSSLQQQILTGITSTVKGTRTWQRKMQALFLLATVTSAQVAVWCTRVKEWKQISVAMERPLPAKLRQNFSWMGSSTQSSAGCKRLIDPAGAFSRLLNPTQEIQTRLITIHSQVTAT